MNSQTITNTEGVLPRRLGAFALAALTIGIIIGSGIFRTPSTIAELVSSGPLIMLIWVLGGIVTICLALCMAELGAMFPKTGGLYVYLEEAFGRRVAFLFGWTFLLISPANLAAITIIMTDYVGRLTGISGFQQQVVATMALTTVCLINILSVRLATRFNLLFTLAKAAALMGISVAVWLFAEPSADRVASVSSDASNITLSLFGLALVAVLWPFEGVSAATSMSGEVKNPARNLPRGLVGGVLCVTILYLVVNLAFIEALSVEGMASSDFVAADAMEQVTGATGAKIIIICAIIATLGAMLAASTCDPRVFFAMARDGVFFKKVGKVHPVWQTPYLAIGVSGILAITYIWVRTFEQLAAQFVLGIWIFYALSVFGLIRLRKKAPEVKRPYKVPLYPWLPLIFLLASSGLLLNAFIEMPIICLINFGIIVAGLPIYELWMRRNKLKTGG